MADPILTSKDRDRILARVGLNPATGCVEWKLSRFTGGYGKTKVAGKNRAAHRMVWIAVNGPIPGDKRVLHHCDNRACVDVWAGHLFLGDHAANMEDMVKKGRHRSQRKTHCPVGHPYDATNTYRCGGHRQCRACAPQRQAEDYRRHREKRKADASAHYYRNRERILARLRAVAAEKRGHGDGR